MANRGQPVGSDADLHTDAAIQSETVGEQAARGISIQQKSSGTQDGAERERVPIHFRYSGTSNSPKFLGKLSLKKQKSKEEVLQCF